MSEAKIRDIGFVYENGHHTPTVLVEFKVGDFDARDRFVAALSAPQEAGKPELSMSMFANKADYDAAVAERDSSDVVRAARALLFALNNEDLAATEYEEANETSLVPDAALNDFRNARMDAVEALQSALASKEAGNAVQVADEREKTVSEQPLEWAKGYAVGYKDGVKDAINAIPTEEVASQPEPTSKGASDMPVYYYWTPKPETGWSSNLATWSQNPGPHKDWDVMAYVTLESANAAMLALASGIAPHQPQPEPTSKGEQEPTRDAWELESDFEHRLNAWHKERASQQREPQEAGKAECAKCKPYRDATGELVLPLCKCASKEASKAAPAADEDFDIAWTREAMAAAFYAGVEWSQNIEFSDDMWGDARKASEAYAGPASQQRALSDEEIGALWRSEVKRDRPDTIDKVRFARAILAAVVKGGE